jgi:hypothetical protein
MRLVTPIQVEVVDADASWMKSIDSKVDGRQLSSKNGTGGLSYASPSLCKLNGSGRRAKYPMKRCQDTS